MVAASAKIAPAGAVPALATRSFEQGLDGFTLESGIAQPVCSPVEASRLERVAGKPRVTLDPPGDYWRTAIDIGQDGKCRVDTAARSATRTVMRSSDFTIATPFIAFRVGAVAARVLGSSFNSRAPAMLRLWSSAVPVPSRCDAWSGARTAFAVKPRASSSSTRTVTAPVCWSTTFGMRTRSHPNHPRPCGASPISTRTPSVSSGLAAMPSSAAIRGQWRSLSGPARSSTGEAGRADARALRWHCSSHRTTASRVTRTGTRF